MKRWILVATLFLPITFTTIPPEYLYASTDEIEVKPVFSCMLNKSFTLEAYEKKSPEGAVFVLEEKHFLGTLGEGPKVEIRRESTHEVLYGDVRMLTLNQGRSGYFFVRVEKGSKPSESDLGDITVMIDNNLFHQREGFLFTGGKLMTMSDCFWRGD